MFISREHTRNYLNSVLRMMVIKESTKLAGKFCSPTGSRHEALTYINYQDPSKFEMQVIVNNVKY